MIELFFIVLIFLLLGFFTGFIDDLYDKNYRINNKQKETQLKIIFISLIAISSIIGYFLFPSPYLGIIIGLLLSGKINQKSFLLSLLFFIPYLFTELDYKVLALFALGSFIDEKMEFNGKRIVSKCLYIGYGILYNIFVLAAFGSFDIGYETKYDKKLNRLVKIFFNKG
jgi:hypothetical protein